MRRAGRVEVIESKVAWLDAGGNRGELPLVELPVSFLEWQLASRRELYRRLREKGQAVPFAPSHLPVLATYNDGAVSSFVNLSAKGVTLLPKPETLDRVVKLIEDLCKRKEEKSNPPTLEGRLRLVEELFGDPSSIDPYVLGGLEIFEGQTFRNLRRDPRAALLFVGEGPHYTSYQVNVIAELVEGDDLRYRYLSGLRRLFEGEAFHVHQTRYACGYVFWVVGVTEKTPRTRRWD